MTSPLLRVAWYRLRTTFRRRRGGYLSIVVLVGLVGGVAMASIAAGRRTQSSYPTFLASTNPSDMTVSVYSPATGDAVAPLTAAITGLPDVERVRTLFSPTVAPLGPDGAPRLSALGSITILGSADGGLLHQDRPAIVQGRPADPDRADQVVMTASAAHLLGARLGQVVPFGFYTRAQTNLPDFGTPAVAPRLSLRPRLVGIAVLDNAVVQDDVDSAYGIVFLTPAMGRRMIAIAPDEAAPVGYALKLVHGSRDVAAVERHVIGILPPGATAQFHVTARVVTQVELAMKPESVALGAFGAIAALVCLIVGMQAIARQLRADEDDRRVLRSLGAGPAAAAGDGMIGVVGAVVVGAFVAGAVAVALSPLSPLGPVRPVYPHPGIAFDWTVLGAGLAVIIGALGVGAAALSYRAAPHRVGPVRQEAPRSSTVARRLEAAGTPAAAVVGVRFALEPGRGATAVPVRSALLGSALAVTLVVAALTFAASLGTLVSHPALYGWNWSYALNPTNALPPQARTLLDHDRLVAAWTGVDYTNIEIDGLSVPVLLTRAQTLAVAPPILSGHGLRADNQIVVGAATLAELHRRVGDTVFVSYGAKSDAPVYVPPIPLVVVGTATFPAVGFESLVADHTSMGTGAMFSQAIFPAAFARGIQNPDPTLNGPELAFVRLRPGVGARAGRADMQRIADATDKVFAGDPNAAENNVVVLGVQRPAQIVNYRSIGSTPVALAGGLALGAIVALALTLAASVRRRRRDLALLKALGFSPRQLAGAVAWQATVAAVVGIVVGVPVGIVLGRGLWTLFARGLNAVPEATVPVGSVVLVAVGALVFSNLVAALPGRDAARTPTALLLHTE